METVTRQMQKDCRVIAAFTEIWCSGHRHEQRRAVSLPGRHKPFQLCQACADLVAYAVTKRIKCPLEPEKPDCKQCAIHCYAPAQRARVRQIMAWSGRRMILRGRLDYIWQYFFKRKEN